MRLESLSGHGRFHRFFVMLLLVAVAAQLRVAAQTEHVVGYCGEDLPETTMGPEGDGIRVSAAIHLPRAKMMRYKGCQLTKIRFAVKEGFENVSVWVRNSLTTSSVVVQSVPTTVTGWNEVVLNHPYTLAGETLFVGYTATQPQGFAGIMADGEGNEYTSWVAVDNQWADYHNHGVGILLIQAVVEGDVYDTDLAMMDLAADSNLLTNGETLRLAGAVVNTGTTPIDGYRLSVSIDGGSSEVLSFDEPLQPEQTADFSHEIALTALGDSRHEVAVRASLGDEADENVLNDELSVPFYVYETTYPRTLLLEHFTSLPCVNCPPADRLLEEVVGERDDVAWVSHHVGYREDEFTIAGSRSMTRFGVYGNPYVMLDRSVVGDNAMPAFSGGDLTEGVARTLFDEAAAVPSLMTLGVEARAEGSRLTLEVTGDGKPYVGELYAGSALHLYLMEDQVTAEKPQAGDANKKIHDNILRAIVTPARGVAPAWDDEGHFGYATTFDIDEQWAVRNLRVVAFITLPAPADTNYPTGAVLNTAQAKVESDVSLGLAGVGAEESSRARTLYYMLSGQPVGGQPARGGVYLMRKNGETKKVIIQ